MVLSNKKLKQKLRAEIAQSIAKVSVSNETDTNPTNQETPKSLKLLLDSKTQKPRLSKREKRRIKVNLENPDGKNGEKAENKVAHVEESEEDGNEKKRKREENGTEDENNGGVDENMGVKEEGGDLNNEEKVSKKKKKRKQKKRRKKGKKEKEEERTEVGNEAVTEQSVAVQSVAENVDYNYSQGNAEDNKKVYVGGIPYYSTEDDVRSYFDHCGTITDIDCMTFPDSGKFRGIAIISFKTVEAAKRALALDGSDMGGLYLKIQAYKATRTVKTTTTDFSPPVLPGYNCIYAGNLSWDITEDDLRNLLSDCNISAIRFGEDKATGEFKGYAHVDFADNVSLTKALQLDQMDLCGRPVRIRHAVPLKKGAVVNPGSVPTTGPTAVKTEAEISKAEPETDNKTAVSSSKKRTCYECGQRGHISSDCPNQRTKEKNPSATVPTVVPVVVPTAVKAEAENSKAGPETDNKAVVSSSKKRTCYECGQRGHISSDCPNQRTKEKNPSATVPTVVPVVVPTAVKAEAEIIKAEPETDNKTAVSSSKLKRRTCYECGQRGHISSDCPNQGTKEKNPSAS